MKIWSFLFTNKKTRNDEMQSANVHLFTLIVSCKSVNCWKWNTHITIVFILSQTNDKKNAALKGLQPRGFTSVNHLKEKLIVCHYIHFCY